MNKSENRENCAKELVAKHPWIDVNYGYEDEEPTGEITTYLDWIPIGWQVAFGEQFCDELEEALQKLPKEEYDGFRVLQAKEKYGSFRFYTSWVNDEIYKIIDKYERLSENTCCMCGEKATYLSIGWVCPYCEECAESAHKRYVEMCGESPFDKFFEKVN